MDSITISINRFCLRIKKQEVQEDKLRKPHTSPSLITKEEDAAISCKKKKKMAVVKDFSMDVAIAALFSVWTCFHFTPVCLWQEFKVLTIYQE